MNGTFGTNVIVQLCKNTNAHKIIKQLKLSTMNR